MMRMATLLLVLCVIQLVICSPLSKNDDDDRSFMPFPADDDVPPSPKVKKSVSSSKLVTPPDAISFMRNFGYLESGPSGGDTETLYSKDSIEVALKEVQKFGAIPQTGTLDVQTMKLLTSPRCGNKDVETKVESGRRKKRYVLGSSGWRKRTILYHIANWSPKLRSESRVNRAMQRAFQAWAQYSHLKFIPSSERKGSDIVISFGRFSHGDRFPFDGPGQVLAHAFYPYDQADSLGGDMHFDDDEDWTTEEKNSKGTDFFTVAVHELGHALGLGHSPVKDSVMFPYYTGDTSESGFTLGQDDIRAMYELYVQKPMEGDSGADFDTRIAPPAPAPPPPTRRPSVTTTTRRTTTTVRTTKRPITGVRYFGSDYDDRRSHYGNKRKENLCDGKYDQFANIRGELFVFKGETLWRFSGRAAPLPGYPTSLRQMFSAFPKEVTKVDAVFERSKDSKIVFFSGKHYWVMDGNRVVENSPLTSLGLPASLAAVDAALVWGKNGRTYLFAGNKYWKMSEDGRSVDLNGYPQDITQRWRGIPADIDAAFTWKDGEIN